MQSHEPNSYRVDIGDAGACSEHCDELTPLQVLSRSGATPKALLEGTRGVLLVDGYSGYNDVEKVSSRRRAACHAHVRRYFFESLKTAPENETLLKTIKKFRP